MSRTSNLTNVLIRIEGYPLFVIFVNELHTVIAIKNVPPIYESHLWDELFYPVQHWGPVNGAIAGKRRDW